MAVIPASGRHAWRRLASTPFLSLGAVLILALGIGSADVLDRVLLRAPAQVSDADRVARVYVGMQSFRPIAACSTLEALATMDEEPQASAAYFTEELSLGRGEHARQLEASHIAATTSLCSACSRFSDRGRRAIAAWVPASRAARVDPVTALRVE